MFKDVGILKDNLGIFGMLLEFFGNVWDSFVVS